MTKCLFLLENAGRLVTMDPARRILRNAWLAARDGAVVALGEGAPPEAIDGTPRDEWTRLDAAGGVVLPGFVNTHHHLYQTRTRAWPGGVDAELFDWLKTLYPVWAKLTDDDFHAGALCGCRELLRTGCTTTTDHHYLFPTDASPELIDITFEAATAAGIRFHPTRGSMSRSQKDGGLPPDSVVQDHDTILADSERVIAKFHDPAPGAMRRVALAPCSPFSITAELMRDTAELARRHGVRLHTHLCETKDEEAYCLQMYGKRPVDLLEDTGWLADDVWLAHGIWFDDEEIRRLGAAGTAIAHCPTSNMRLGSGVCRVKDLRAAGSPVGLAVDGSASNDSSHMLAELRQCLLLHRVVHGAAAMSVMDVLELATLGGAACLGRDDIGSLEPGKRCDLAVFSLEAPGFENVGDPVAALLLCHPVEAERVVIEGREVPLR
jgi:8-oxoguanine deaminase